MIRPKFSAALSVVAFNLLSGMLLAACSLPAAAPTSRELTAVRPDTNFRYALVNVDGNVTDILNRQQLSFGATFKSKVRYTPKSILRAGDSVAITIYETGGSSLFPSPAGVSNSMAGFANATTGGPPPVVPPTGSSSANTIPPQVIEADGTIGVPFAGRLKVAGLTPSQVGGMIERELKHKAVAPQVVVTASNIVTNSATVNGEVTAPRMVSLSLRGERVLDVIAAAGGPKFPSYETYVSVVRDGEVGTMLLQSLVSNPTENVMVRPQDQIYLTRNPRTFVVMGATLRPAVFTFDRERITLAEAIAQAGGPIDTIGDLGGVYLFRYEPWRVAKLVMDPASLPDMTSAPPEFVPVLYRVVMKEAEGFFLSQAIQIRDKDIVLIANAEGTQLMKLLTLVRGFTGIAYDLKRQYTP